MKKFLDILRTVQKKFDEGKYTCKNIEGKPFFGEITIHFNDGKIVHGKSKSNGDIEIAESNKI